MTYFDTSHQRSVNVHYSTPDRRAEYCDDRVCPSVCLHVCVCPRVYIWKYTSDLYQFLCMLPMAVVRSSSGGVAISSCTSGFMDDVVFVHKPRQLNETAQLMEAHGLAYKRRVEIAVAGQWTGTHGRSFWTPRSGPIRQQWACWMLERV